MFHSSSSSRGSRRSSIGSASAIPPAYPQQPPNDLIRRGKPRHVLGGRSVELPIEESTLLFGQLEPLGWHNLHTNLSLLVEENMVREFYDNLNITYENGNSENPVATTNVAGRTITISRALLALFLNIPDVGECIYFKRKESDLKKNFTDFNEQMYYETFAKPSLIGYKKGRMEESDLLEQYRTLNAFLDANILPTTGTNNSVSKYQGFIIYCIAKKRQLCLPYIILREMEDMSRNNKKSCGYGGFLTTIFQNLHIPINWDNCVPLKNSINATTLNLRNSHPFFVEEEEEEQEPEQDQYQDQYQYQYQYQGQEHEQVQEFEQQQHHQSQEQLDFESLIRNNPSIDEIGADLHFDLYNRF